MKKKVLAALLCTTMAASMLTACGGEKKETEKKEETKTESSTEKKTDTKVTEKTEITFWHAMSGSNEEAIQKITDDFMEQNENVSVKLVNQGGYMDLFDKLMASAKADQLPTMTQIYSNRLSWYVSKGLVADLTPYMEDEQTGFTEEDLADIPEMFLADGIWDGKQYAIPFNKSQMVLYYNETMFEEAGVEVPKTWDEWTAAAEKLTVDEDKDGEPEVYGCVFANNLSTDIAPWLKQAGGSTMNEETNELYFDTPETKEAIEFLNSMFQAKTARFAGDELKKQIVPVQDGRSCNVCSFYIRTAIHRRRNDGRYYYQCRSASRT